MSIKKLLNKFFCEHKIFITTTTSEPDGFFIVKTLAQCEKCGKTFAVHPDNSRIIGDSHHALIYEYWINKLKNSRQNIP